MIGLLGVLPEAFWLVLAQKLNQQAVSFSCIFNELPSVMETFGVNADDLVVVVQKLDVRHGG